MSQKSNARVLIIDDNPDESKQLREMLGPLYIIDSVQGYRQALVKKAVERANHFRPHITIVDLSLNPVNSSDRSGFKILEQLSSSCYILYSAHVTPEISRLAEKYGAVAVGKAEHPQLLLDIVAEKAQLSCAAVKNVVLHRMPAPSSEEIIQVLGLSKRVPADLADDVLVQLFPKNNKITLKKMEESIATPGSVSRGHSVVLKVWRDEKPNPLVIKFALTKNILLERQNYFEFIDGYIMGDFRADLKNSLAFWDIGAILYSLVGLSNREWRTFREFYLSTVECNDILRPLTHFFSEAWGELYKQQHEKLKFSLFVSYDKALTQGKSLDLTKRLKKSPEQGKLLDFPDLSISMLNPISWVLRHKDDSIFPPSYPVYQAVTHGDLHGDNLIVDDSHAWAIDFERSGQGHILRDFVELELDIVSRLISPDTSPLELLGLFIALTDSRKSGDKNRLADKYIIGEQSKKALEVILGLREIAQQQTEFTDYREYYWGLLLDAVFVATLTPDDTQQSNTPRSEDIQRKRTLIYGAVLCSRLENWNEKWPVDDMRKVKFDGMKILSDSSDKSPNQEVIV